MCQCQLGEPQRQVREAGAGLPCWALRSHSRGACRPLRLTTRLMDGDQQTPRRFGAAAGTGRPQACKSDLPWVLWRGFTFSFFLSFFQVLKHFQFWVFLKNAFLQATGPESRGRDAGQREAAGQATAPFKLVSCPFDYWTSWKNPKW